jgi:hypothetical protein
MKATRSFDKLRMTCYRKSDCVVAATPRDDNVNVDYFMLSLVTLKAISFPGQLYELKSFMDFFGGSFDLSVRGR